MSTRTQDLYEVTLHWRGGETESGQGWGCNRMEAAADAMNTMGIGAGALAALDYWDAKKIKDAEGGN